MEGKCAACEDFPDSPLNGDQGFVSLKPNIAIIVIGLGFTLVVVAAFAIFAKFLRSHMSNQNSSGSRMWEDVVKDGGSLEDNVIKSLPLVVYSAESFQGLNLDLECAVCLSQFEEEEELRLLPNCKHMFHPACVDNWLLSHPFCPMCRSSIMSSSWTTPGSSTVLSTTLASIPEESQIGSEDRHDSSPGLHVEIAVLESVEARFEGLKDSSNGSKGGRCAGGTALTSQEGCTSELQRNPECDSEGASSTTRRGNTVSLPVSAV